MDAVGLLVDFVKARSNAVPMTSGGFSERNSSRATDRRDNTSAERKHVALFRNYKVDFRCSTKQQSRIKNL